MLARPAMKARARIEYTHYQHTPWAARDLEADEVVGRNKYLLLAVHQPTTAGAALRQLAAFGDGARVLVLNVT